MIRLLLSVLLPFISLFPTLAQNLVKNSSFEQNEYTSRFLNTTGRDFERQAKHWTVPNQASTDLISPRMKNKNITTIPPHTGKHMAGIVINGDFWAEYVSVKLSKPLQPGVKYYVEFWIAMPPVYSKRKIKPTYLNPNFGVLFADKIFNLDKNILPGKPQVHATTQTLIEPQKWTKIFGTYTATEASTHLYIGQFLNPEVDPNIVIGYFFLDDVFVEAFSSTAVDFVPSSYYRIKGSTASVIMQNIYFETDKYELLDVSESELDKLVNIMNKNPSISIEILGHTDDQGNEEHNSTLSENRAASVYNYLVQEGVPSNRLKSKGMGFAKPVATNQSDEGRQKNRRVEFVVTGDVSANNLPQGPGDVYRFASDAGSESVLQQSFTDALTFKSNCFDESMAPQEDIAQATLLTKSSPTDAREYILKQTKDEQTVFINEYALNPQNRAFVKDMLTALRDQGFGYLALDALSGKDKNLQERGYPVLNSGYLTREPVFGQLIRTAIELGFEIVAYQPSPTEVEKATSIISRNYGISSPVELEATAKRWAAAMNINRLIKKDPAAKVLVYTSESFLNESADEAVEKSVAAWYKSLSSKNPLTIDQATMTEKCAVEQHPLFAKRNIKSPTVFLQKNKVFNTGDTDIQVFHPETGSTYQRPNWMQQSSAPYLFNPDKHGMTYPCMVMAYLPDDDTDFAVPVDVFEFKNNRVATALMLPKGDYVFIMTDQQKHRKLEVKVE